MDSQERKNFIKQTFNTVAPGYDNPALCFFHKSAAQLPRYFSFRGDEHVLDAAAGTGMASLSMANVLPQGKVTAVDMSEGMLQQAKMKAKLQGLQNVEFVQMDIETLDFPQNQFDHVNCSFGLFFVEDMESLLKGLVDKLKPTGKFMSCCFSENSFQPHTELFFNRIQKYGVEIPDSVGFARLADEEKSSALYKTANLKNIKTFRHDAGYTQKDANDWWDIVWYAGFRGFVEQLDETALKEFKREHLDEINQLFDGNGIAFPVDVIFTLGEK